MWSSIRLRHRPRPRNGRSSDCFGHSGSCPMIICPCSYRTGDAVYVFESSQILLEQRNRFDASGSCCCFLVMNLGSDILIIWISLTVVFPYMSFQCPTPTIKVGLRVLLTIEPKEVKFSGPETISRSPVRRGPETIVKVEVV